MSLAEDYTGQESGTGWLGPAPRELRFITIVMRQPWTLARHSDSVGWSPGHWTLQHDASPLTLQHSAAVLCSNWTAAGA